MFVHIVYTELLMKKLKQHQSKVQAAIESGISRAEARQKDLAVKSFSYAEKLEGSVRRYNVGQARNLYLSQSRKVFSALRALNVRANLLATTLIDKVDVEVAKAKDFIDLSGIEFEQADFD